jgi:hypothetical protein
MESRNAPIDWGQVFWLVLGGSIFVIVMAFAITQ